MTEIHTLIARALAAPKRFAVVTRYASGVEKRHGTASLAQAENWAIGERRKIGRNLISRDTGETVRVVSVEIVSL